MSEKTPASRTPESSSARAKKRAAARRRKLRAVRAGLRVLEIAAPPLAARAATALFRTPPRHVPWDREGEILAAGRVFSLDVPGGPGRDARRVRAWRWGVGDPVLLVHGWGSSGGRLGSFVEPLVEAGHSVVAFDAPGHGEAKLRRSSLPEFLFTIEAAQRELGDFAGIVAHSLGGAATTLALDRGTRARRVVLIAPSSDPGGYTRRFAEVVGIGEGVRRRMEDAIEKKFGLPWSKFDVLAAAKRLAVPALVIHDGEDSDVPWSEGEALARAWPGAELVATRGLGHTRIVHDPAVVARAVEFLESHAAPAAAARARDSG